MGAALDVYSMFLAAVADWDALRNAAAEVDQNGSCIPSNFCECW